MTLTFVSRHRKLAKNESQLTRPRYKDASEKKNDIFFTFLRCVETLYNRKFRLFYLTRYSRYLHVM